MGGRQNAKGCPRSLSYWSLFVLPSVYLHVEEGRLQLSKWAPELVHMREVGTQSPLGFRMAARIKENTLHFQIGMSFSLNPVLRNKEYSA